MKPLLLTLLLLLPLTTTDQELPDREWFTIGRFIITKDHRGYQAQTDSLISGYNRRCINSINEIKD